MSKEDFIDKDVINIYKIKMPDHLKPYTGQALKFFYISNPEIELDNFKENIHSIQQIALSLHDWKKEKTTAALELNFYPGMFIAAEKRIKYILPEVKKIREELFRTQEAPFSYDKAIEWLRKEAKRERDDFYKKHQETQEDIQKLKDRVHDLIDKLNEIQPWDHGIGFKFITIPIKTNPLGPDTNEFITFPGTKLRKLANTIDRLSKNTRFIKFSLLIFILTGIKPMLPSCSIVKEASYGVGGKKVELKLFRPFNQREFIKLFKPIEEFMFRKKKLKGKGIKVCKFIEKIGPIPSKNKMGFWKEALKQWNKTYPKEKYAGESSLRMAYSRVKKRIESL